MTHFINDINFSVTLQSWYSANKRDLPWRNIVDPYKIWLSEIILQQTRVNQGLSYFFKFVENYPTVADLALASEDDVLKLWQGLGYYSRARNLHKAAKLIVSDYGGNFPQNHAEILKLPGIGDYTAAAISSFAFNQPFAVVDGNVYRVLSRVFGVETPIDSSTGKKEFSSLAKNLLSLNNPGEHNQAVMEFGALQCVPVSPNCSLCPFQQNCKAFDFDLVARLPVKEKKTKVTNRYFNYLHIKLNTTTFLQKRTGKDVWHNLYEFPLIEADHLLTVEELFENEYFQQLFSGGIEVELMKKTNPMKHVLSHRVIYACFFTLKISDSTNSLLQLESVNDYELDKFAVSRLMELFIEKQFK